MAQWHKDKAKHFIIELRKESLVKSFIRFVLVSREIEEAEGEKKINCESLIKWGENYCIHCVFCDTLSGISFTSTPRSVLWLWL